MKARPRGNLIFKAGIQGREAGEGGRGEGGIE